MAGSFPLGVNPCLLDYTEYLCDKAGLHEQTIYGLLEQYIKERGAEQEGIFLNPTGVQGTTTGQGAVDETSTPRRTASRQSRTRKGGRSKSTLKRRDGGSGPQDSDGSPEDHGSEDPVTLMSIERGPVQPDGDDEDEDEDFEPETDSLRGLNLTSHPQTIRNKRRRLSSPSDTENDEPDSSRRRSARHTETEDPPTSDSRVPTFAPAPSIRHGNEATRTHFNLLCTKKKIHAGDQLQIPQSPTHHADGTHTALNDVYAIMQYVSQGPTSSVSSWLAYCPALLINAVPIVGKGPEVFKNQLEQLGFVGPNIRKWSNTVRVFRGGVDLGTVTEVKDRFLV